MSRVIDEEREKLIALARAHDATDEEIAEALGTGELGALALERALYPRADLVSFEDAAKEAGIEPDDAARFFGSLGFPDPRANPPLLSRPEVELLTLMAGAASQILGWQATHQIARVVGSATARVAESVVDAFRLQSEVPQQEAGVPYSDIAAGYVEIAKDMAPKFGDALGALFQRHMIGVIYSNWSVDEAREAITIERVVGFADLVGYTASATAASAGALAAMVDDFEERVAHAVSRHGGRVVKLIGDEAMFVVEDPAQAGPIALELVAEFGAGIRVGMAHGSAVTLRGDYYGEVVNLASRLTGVADPGTVLMSESLALLRGPDGAEPVGPLVLKGFKDAVPAFRLR